MPVNRITQSSPHPTCRFWQNLTPFTRVEHGRHLRWRRINNQPSHLHVRCGRVGQPAQQVITMLTNQQVYDFIEGSRTCLRRLESLVEHIDQQIGILYLELEDFEQELVLPPRIISFWRVARGSITDVLATPPNAPSNRKPC